MKKVNRAGELLWILGMVLAGLAIALCKKADLGVTMIAAPVFILHEFFSPFASWLTVGMTEYMLQGVLLLLLWLLTRRFKWQYLLSFLTAVTYGQVVDLFLFLLRDVAPQSYLDQWLMLIFGELIGGVAVACFFRTYLPKLVYELFVSELAKRFGLRLIRVKSIFDLSFLAAGFLLAIVLFPGSDLTALFSGNFHNIGLGTLLIAGVNAPVIRMMGKPVDLVFEASPRFPKLKAFLQG